MGQNRKRPLIIGVTGPIGAGKSTVSDLFGRWGARGISADSIARSIVDHNLTVRRDLRSVFGDDVIANGKVDRALLAHRAFASRAATLRLNRIVHPPLIRRILSELRSASSRPGTPAIVIDAALLVEWGTGQIPWDVLVGVWAPYRLRMARLRARGLSSARIRAFAAAQLPWRTKQKHCDIIVKNDSTPAELKRRARLCWENLLSF